MRWIKENYVYILLVVTLGWAASTAYAQDAGAGDPVNTASPRIVLDQDLGVVAKIPTDYTVVPVEPLETDADGKVLVPQGTVEQMSEAQVAVTIVRSYKLGEWMLLALAITQLLIRVLKNKDVTKTIMPQYGTLVVLTLCAVSSVLSAVVGGMNPVEAALIFVLTGAPKWFHDTRLEWHRVKSEGDKE